MEDILALYELPRDDDYPLVCMDETTKQLVEEVRPPLMASRGQVERYDFEYERNGVGHLLLYFEPLQGTRHVEVTENRTALTWAQVTAHLLQTRYRGAKKIRLVLDNLNTHRPESFYQAFEPEKARRLVERIEWHYTPIHASWLNMAEIDLSRLSKQCLDRRIPDINALYLEVDAWQRRADAFAGKIDWRFNAADARIKLKRLYPTLPLSPPL